MTDTFTSPGFVADINEARDSVQEAQDVLKELAERIGRMAGKWYHVSPLTFTVARDRTDDAWRCLEYATVALSG